ncbi:hypothetical protein C2E23DRAFT_421970 [Lenzites betulinus]|nr:hypothetical protein C2E23DRAFT_421970 [Lenzites betulinus]
MAEPHETVRLFLASEARQSPASTLPGLFSGDPPATTDREANAAAGQAPPQARPDIPAQVPIEDVYKRRKNVFTPEQKEQAWSNAASMVESYSDAMVKRWKEEIDTYLVFAGLFSSVLTTLSVQSYPLLQPPPPDPSISILQHISVQLASFSVNPPFVNSTQSSGAGGQDASSPAPVPRWAVWLNGLWFSSLILSLTSASVGIMAKQWLNEYSSGVSGTSRSAVRVRQHRLNNLRAWHVEDVVNTIPVLLQLALAFFLSGLLILLWNYNNDVAAIASALVGVLAVFTLFTTLLPLFSQSCSYLTSHIRMLHSLWQTMAAQARTATGRFVDMMIRLRDTSVKAPPKRRVARKQTWQGRERSAIEKRAGDLDIQSLVEAYNITLHPDALSAASVCLMDFYHEDVVFYFRQLHKSAGEHFGAAADCWDGPLAFCNHQLLLWLLVILCKYRSGLSLEDDQETALAVYFKCGLWSSTMQAADAEWALSALNALIGHMQGTEDKTTEGIDQYLLGTKRRTLLDTTVGHPPNPLTSLLLPALKTTYRGVRLKEQCLVAAASDEVKAAHSWYLSTVNGFLEGADRALASSLPRDDLETVKAYVRDVLAALARTLVNVFTEDRARITIYAWALLGVMHRLAYDVSDGVLLCIPDDLRTDVLRMTDVLAESVRTSDDNF